MDRRDTLLVLLTLGALSLAAHAQPIAKPARIGFLFTGTLAQRPQAQGFWQGLQELGYTPGRKNRATARARAGACRLEAGRAGGCNASGHYRPQRATSSIPIVMAITNNPI